jgi:hypothetical protein|tara:strand:+ start:915 stop:1886 length:972 start_codon:yes stop_codon:yes gene_type:complete
MIKEVKETTRSKNFYFTIFDLLKKGLRPSQICKDLDISKQKLNYYISSLKHSGFIEKIGYGIWKIIKDLEVKEVKKTTRVAPKQLELLTSDRVRGHAFQFVLKLPKNLRNWNKREQIFNKTNFSYDPLILGGLNRGQKIVFKGRKIWLTDKSIIIYEKASYISNTAQEAKDYAISDLLNLVKTLERKLQANFTYEGKYKFKVSRQHYALIKNALAKQYDREGKKLEIYNSSGLWFLIDNSFNLHEAETLNPKTAVKDNEKVQNFFNGLKDQENYTPAFVVNSIAKVTANQELYTRNISSHIKAIQDLGMGVLELTKLIKEIKK